MDQVATPSKQDPYNGLIRLSIKLGFHSLLPETGEWGPPSPSDKPRFQGLSPQGLRSFWELGLPSNPEGDSPLADETGVEGACGGGVRTVTACEAQAGPGAEGGSRRTGESDTRSLSQGPHLRARPTSRSGNADALTLKPPVATSPRLRCAKRLTQHVFGKGTVTVGKAKPSSFLSHAGREGRRPRLTGTSGPSGLSLLIVPGALGLQVELVQKRKQDGAEKGPPPPDRRQGSSCFCAPSRDSSQGSITRLWLFLHERDFEL